MTSTSRIVVVVLDPAIDLTQYWRDHVLVLRGWPDGFCPVHAFTPFPCHVSCVRARLEFAEAAQALEYYWERLGYRTEIGTQ